MNKVLGLGFLTVILVLAPAMICAASRSKADQDMLEQARKAREAFYASGGNITITTKVAPGARVGTVVASVGGIVYRHSNADPDYADVEYSFARSRRKRIGRVPVKGGNVVVQIGKSGIVPEELSDQEEGPEELEVSAEGKEEVEEVD